MDELNNLLHDDPYLPAAPGTDSSADSIAIAPLPSPISCSSSNGCIDFEHAGASIDVAANVTISENCEGNMPVEETGLTPVRGTKRKRQNQRKLSQQLRNSGQPYRYQDTDGRQYVRPERRIRPIPCGSGTKKDGTQMYCRYSCGQNFSEEERQKIFQEFWSLNDYQRQQKFLVRHTEKSEVQRRRKRKEESNKADREYSASR